MDSFRYTRSYTGKIQSVVLDWAGTVVDFGCVAPAVVFQKVFENAGVPVTIEEARVPMGTYKKDHIREMTRMSSIRQRWQDAHGIAPTEQDVESMFDAFIPLQLECLSDYSTLIPGALNVISEMKNRGYLIGSTTGYTSAMMEIVSAGVFLAMESQDE